MSLTLARELWDKKQYWQAELAYREVMAEAELNPGETDLSQILTELSELRNVQGKHGEAKQLAERAIEILEAADIVDVDRLVRSLRAFAEASLGINERDEAEAAYRKAIDLLERQGRMDGSTYACLQFDLGVRLYCSGRYAEAVEHFQLAWKMNKVMYGLCHHGIAKCFEYLASIYHRREERSKRPLEPICFLWGACP